ncbi:MAG: putative signal transducing protein [Gaiellaceae bacterium]
MDEAEEGVSVATVSNEVEAEVVCGLLRAHGIECGHRVTEAIDSPLEEFASDGPREVLVHPSDAATARELLANVQPQNPD